jgi:Ca2+/Na+ antiporter
MIKTITIILMLISSVASIYYAVGGTIRPETALVYNKANIPRMGIQLLSLFLAIGGMLLLFPQTFKLGAVFLIIHSLITIVCFILIRDWRGGTFEFLFLQIPFFLVWTDYPLSVHEKIRNLFT